MLLEREASPAGNGDHGLQASAFAVRRQRRMGRSGAMALGAAWQSHGGRFSGAQHCRWVALHIADLTLPTAVCFMTALCA